MEEYKTPKEKRDKYKIYYMKNKDKIMAKKICDECNREYYVSCKTQHNNSMKHKMVVLEKENTRLKNNIV